MIVIENELILNGTQEFLGMTIPIIEGGFGENRKVILAKTVAEIHGVEQKVINQLINTNLADFEIGVDILDVKNSVITTDPLLTIGFNKQSIANSKNIYVLSEQGYMALVGLMRTDKAREIRKQLRREYFAMREVIHNTMSLTDLIILKVVKANTVDERMLAMQEYNSVIVKPLEETIEKQAPMVVLAELRIDKIGRKIMDIYIKSYKK